MIIVLKAFLLGFTAAVGAWMCWQDTLGLEAWIARIREDWVTISPLWGTGIVVYALIGLYGLARGSS